MNCKIKPLWNLSVEIDGQQVSGDFHIDSEWEGFLKLKCDAPCMALIIRKPNMAAVNPYDYVPTIFGGGQNPKRLESVDAEVVSQDFIFPKKPHYEARAVPASPVDLGGSGRCG